MKKIIIAPLNWGLGHATRCVPIIKALIENKFSPIIASDGDALRFLQKEFPNVAYLELPSYHISYAKNIKWSLMLQLPKILKAVRKERQIIEAYVASHKEVIGVISDNRFGIKSKKVSSVYVTHQLNVLSGWSTFMTSKIHQNIIKKFDECWIPDDEHSTFSGKLSSVENKSIHKKHIGLLSRFQHQNSPIKNDVLIILSGVEPQRTLLAQKLKAEFENYKGKVVLVQGKIEKQQKITQKKQLKIYNFMLSDELETAINQSELIICRSGYSSIMDLAILQKKVFFIPTKHQNEQEYLADYLSKKKFVPFCHQEDFTLEKITDVEGFTGLKAKKTSVNPDLFRLFERK